MVARRPGRVKAGGLRRDYSPFALAAVGAVAGHTRMERTVPRILSADLAIT